MALHPALLHFAAGSHGKASPADPSFAAMFSTHTHPPALCFGVLGSPTASHLVLADVWQWLLSEMFSPSKTRTNGMFSEGTSSSMRLWPVSAYPSPTLKHPKKSNYWLGDFLADTLLSCLPRYSHWAEDTISVSSA